MRLGMVEGDKVQHAADVLVLWLALFEPRRGIQSIDDKIRLSSRGKQLYAPDPKIYEV